MKKIVLVVGIAALLGRAIDARAACPPLPGPFTSGSVCPYADQSKCFTADNANTIVQALSGMCDTLAAPLPAAQGGLGQAQPTCGSGQFVTCNGTVCSCRSTGTAAAISVAVASKPTTLALDVEGTADWIAWNNATSELGYGQAGYRRKALGGGQIADLGFVGAGTVFAYQADLMTVTWTASDSVTNAAGSNAMHTGVFGGPGLGFRMVVPADTFQRTLRVYASHWNTRVKLTCRLSDGSLADVTQTNTVTSGAEDLVYVITYNAAHDGQRMTVTLRIEEDYTGSNTGNVTMMAATLQ